MAQYFNQSPGYFMKMYKFLRLLIPKLILPLALKAYHVNNPISNLWLKEYDKFNIGSLVLFNPNVFSEKWKGRNPMINWDKMNRDYQLFELKEYQKGCRLYEIR